MSSMSQPERRWWDDPPRVVRDILLVFAVVFTGSLLLNTGVYYLSPDESVFLVKEASGWEVWPNTSSYEQATGKKWNEHPPGQTQLVATFHGARQQRAWENIVPLSVALALTLIALRKTGQAAQRMQDQGGFPAAK
jgi:hypothetical protein